MGGAALFLAFIAALVVFDLAALRWGADSRLTLRNDHRR